ncbi:MAG: hypothetical protein K6F00_08205 [Lachnospiraceae bacterium]|nr:hypothetical protein [Lachnospiraceae bacterium]
MNSNQFFPFERNRYYAGKMLTSADFVAEQNYYLNKHRFLSALMYGDGIVCGMGVVSLDDLSLLIESGVAIDGYGREIVIENSVVKKLSTIDGFDSLETNKATLCLRYKEKEAHTVYSVNHKENENEYEYNRINETYQLFLVDSDSLTPEMAVESEFLSKEVVLTSENFKAELEIPSVVCIGRNVKAVLRVTKKTAEDVALSYNATIQAPGFETADGSHETDISVHEIRLEKGESYEKEFWFHALDTDVSETSIILKSGSAHAVEGENDIPVQGSFSIKVLLENVSPIELITRQIGQTSLEMKNIGGDDDIIRLAELYLVRTESAYVIEETVEKGVKKYITPPAQELVRHDYLEYFVKNVDLVPTETGNVEVAPQNTERIPTEMPEIATGTLEIPLGTDVSPGDICYSGEIIHGLGRGNVYVDVGYEYLTDDPALSQSSKSTIYGNSQLFANDMMAKAETAIKVLNDKGSFVVAAKILDNVNFLTLTYRWVAIKFPSGEAKEKLTVGDQSIAADTPTFVMGPKESHFFGVSYHNMEPASISYELTEPASGEISADGIYTAPTKEGVYEIRIYCTDNQLINTYAYAIVKKKNYDEE